MRLAFIFPGQGAQYVGMGKDLYENSPDAKKIFDEADKVLGFSLSKLMFEGPFEELTKTENCQPAVLTVAVAALEALKIAQPQLMPSYVAGLSLGEYSALVACGIMDFKDAVYLVRKRGEFMESAAKKNPGKMSCVLGLEQDVAVDVCRISGCEIANLNCPGQVVISGTNIQIEKASQIAMEKGAKRVIALDVSGAFHSSLMNDASLSLKTEIDKVRFNVPECPLICNVDAVEQVSPEIIKSNLIKQVNSATYWEKSMRYLLAKGITDYYEIGPGTVLKGLFKKIESSAKVVNIGKWEDVQSGRF